MSISPASPSQAAAQLALLLQPDAGLAAKLQLGQIVQGQVLRHYEGNRYLVRVLGHEAVWTARRRCARTSSCMPASSA